ncbi:MAG: hypothetical protein M1837_006561 [Sclerophora amabilis]|nr:MAG: hypothetical protein M1837_006561 [Sclerophora amabilis]
MLLLPFLAYASLAAAHIPAARPAIEHSDYAIVRTLPFSNEKRSLVQRQASQKPPLVFESGVDDSSFSFPDWACIRIIENWIQTLNTRRSTFRDARYLEVGEDRFIKIDLFWARGILTDRRGEGRRPDFPVVDLELARVRISANDLALDEYTVGRWLDDNLRVAHDEEGRELLQNNAAHLVSLRGPSFTSLAFKIGPGDADPARLSPPTAASRKRSESPATGPNPPKKCIPRNDYGGDEPTEPATILPDAAAPAPARRDASSADPTASLPQCPYSPFERWDYGIGNPVPPPRADVVPGDLRSYASWLIRKFQESDFH